MIWLKKFISWMDDNYPSMKKNVCVRDRSVAGASYQVK